MRTCLVHDNNDVWYLDSGATCHITSNKEWFIKYEILQMKILFILEMILNVKLKDWYHSNYT